METKILSANEEDLAEGGRLLRLGKTVVFPTETVYGLGANALDDDAVKNIYAAKGRPSDNPLIVHIADLKMLSELAAKIPETAEELMKKFWPGPLTLIFQKTDRVSSSVTGGLDTVAVRCPSNKTARRLIELAGVPVAAPSANLSGKPSPTEFRHVKDDLFGRVDAIVEGEDSDVGVESTVLDISGDVPVLLRPGAVTLEQLREILGDVEVVTSVKDGETPKSPGLKYKHYAPRAEVYILKGSLSEAFEFIRNEANKQKTGMLVFDEFADVFVRIPGLFVLSLGGREKPSDAAHRLFSSLREMDAAGVDKIYAPEIPKSGVWLAVRNRLYRAAAEKILDIREINNETLNDSDCRKIKKVLFVCTGNTCRSPMAEYLFRAECEKQGKDISVSSAGLFADGSPISAQAAEALRELSIDAEGCSSQQLTYDMVDGADLVLAMTDRHRQMICMSMPVAEKKTETLAAFAGFDGDVPDPFGGDIAVYRRCRDRLRQLIIKVLEKIG